MYSVCTPVRLLPTEHCAAYSRLHDEDGQGHRKVAAQRGARRDEDGRGAARKLCRRTFPAAVAGPTDDEQALATRWRSPVLPARAAGSAPDSREARPSGRDRSAGRVPCHLDYGVVLTPAQVLALASCVSEPSTRSVVSLDSLAAMIALMISVCCLLDRQVDAVQHRCQRRRGHQPHAVADSPLIDIKDSLMDVEVRS
jgi:hypothetical protein